MDKLIKRLELLKAEVEWDKDLNHELISMYHRQKIQRLEMRLTERKNDGTNNDR